MTLRAKLLLAQLPLALALLALAAVTVWSVSRLGGQTGLILSENYRSVLAAQRMNEAIERIDSAAMFLAGGQIDRALEQVKKNLPRFDAELAVEAQNITEPGETEAVARLKAAWADYKRELDAYLGLRDSQVLQEKYFREMEPRFHAVKKVVEEILNVNQDAMVLKGEDAAKFAGSINQLMVGAALALLALGVTLSMTATARLLRPLSVLNQAVGRLGAGDFQARALVQGTDEIAQVAHRFNTMAEHLSEYRSSSLGELLLAQRASQAAIDSLPDPTIVYTLDGEVLNTNRASEELLAAAEKQQATPRLQEVLARVRAHVVQGRGPYVPKGFEETLALAFPDGERSFLPRATPVYEEQGKIAGATVILQDVTKLRRFDELKNDLVATVAHEFRTPLTSLRMSLHLLLEQAAGPLTEKQADLLYAGREDCERLQGIVDELLDLARIQSGRIELRTRPMPVNTLVQAALANHRAAAEAKGVHMESEPLPSRCVQADADRVQLVFSNLLTNAVRHTEAQGQIHVRARPADGQVRFEVTDTGEGIPREYQQAIFEKFFRVPGVEMGGAGLGLFIAREIVDAHGGRMGVESKPGQGSMFWFTLPLAHETADAS